MLTLEALYDKRKRIEESLSNLRKQYDKLGNKILNEVDILNEINETIDLATLKEDDVKALLNVYPETKRKRQLREKFLEKYGLSSNSHFPETCQSCIQIALYKYNDEITEKTYEGIKLLLPYIKPLKNGYKKFSIFEHTLSLNYSYYLQVTEDEEYQIVTHLSFKDPIYKSKDLMKVLKYIQKNLYYQKSDKE